jgi:hypothetical protein
MASAAEAIEEPEGIICFIYRTLLFPFMGVSPDPLDLAAFHCRFWIKAFSRCHHVVAWNFHRSFKCHY